MKYKKTKYIRKSEMSFFRDSDGNTVIWQAPNVPLYGWFMFKVLAVVVATGRFHSVFSKLSAALLFTWAFLELTSGVSYFRRLLGLMVLLTVVVGYFR